MILYKYLSGNLIKVIQNAQIRYTQFAEFNDPFEMKPNINKIVTDEEAKFLVGEKLKEYEEVLSFLEKNDGTNRKAVFNAMISGIEDLTPTFIPMIKNQMEKTFNEKIGVLCLTESKDSLLMWAHYAERHTGYVIGFDCKDKWFNCRISKNDDFRDLRKVEYIENRPTLTLHDMESKDIFFCKSKEWAYEKEWRIIKPLDAANYIEPRNPYPICLFSFPREIIKEIILGCMISNENKSNILKILRENKEYKDVMVYQSELDKESYKLNFKRIK